MKMTRAVFSPYHRHRQKKTIVRAKLFYYEKQNYVLENPPGGVIILLLSFSYMGYAHEPDCLTMARELGLLPNSVIFETEFNETFLIGNEGEDENNDLRCGTIEKDNSRYRDISPDKLLFDRFGNAYTADELIVQSTLSGDCDNTGYFEIIYDDPDNFDTNMKNVVCDVFSYLSSQIDQRVGTEECSPEPVVIYITDDVTINGVGAAATPYYGGARKEAGCDQLVYNRAYYKINGGHPNSLSYYGIFDNDPDVYPLIIDGRIDINMEDINWFYDWESGSTPNNTEHDAFTAILHESLHILGYASVMQITRYDNPNWNFYSIWDRYLSQNAAGTLLPFINGECEDNCWSLNPDVFTTYLEGDGVIEVDWTQSGVPDIEVGEGVTVPVWGGLSPFTGALQDGTFSMGFFLNALSHLGDWSVNSVNYVMSPNLPAGLAKRDITDAEFEILCDLGYKGPSCNGCFNVASYDASTQDIITDFEFYEESCLLNLFEGCAGEPFFISKNQLLLNDVTNGETLEIADIGFILHNGITIEEGMQNGEDGYFFTSEYVGTVDFFYVVNSCACKPHTAGFEILFDYCPPCNEPCEDNLLCADDFESFELHDNIGSITHLGFPFIFVDPNDGEILNQNTADIKVEAGGNHYLYLIRKGGGNNPNVGEYFALKLKEGIQPNCVLNFDLDICGETTTDGELTIWGSEFPPCNPLEALIPFDCNALTDCGGHTFEPICLGTINPTSSTTNSDVLNFTSQQGFFQNTANFPVNYIILASTGTRGLFLDNFHAEQECSADFDYDVVCTTVTFFNVFPNVDTYDYSWDFGDGNTSTEMNPTHTYNAEGSYMVMLTITDDCGNEFIVKKKVETGDCGCPNCEPCVCENEDSYLLDLSPSGTLLSTLIDDGMPTDPLPAGNTLDLTGNCMSISGKLIVDVDYSITGGEILMSPGASIDVIEMPVGSPTLSFTNVNENGGIHGCDYMWRGIKTESSTVLVMHNSYIQDAQYAVWPANKSSIDINHTRFYDNYVGVYFHEAGSYLLAGQFYSNTFREDDGFLMPYPGQTPLVQAGQMPFAGIYYFNTGTPTALLRVGTSTINPLFNANNFTDMQNGIIVEGRVQVEVVNSLFRHIRPDYSYSNEAYPYKGFGIHVKTKENGTGFLYQRPIYYLGQTFDDCRTGIWTEGIGVDIAGNPMNNVDIGIEVNLAGEEDEIKIFKNRIICNYIGINLHQNDEAAKMEVLYNRIDLGTEGTQIKGAAIAVNEALNRPALTAFISNNTIKLYGGGGTTGLSSRGISLRAANLIQVDNNSIECNATVGGNVGIYHTDGYGDFIQENQITGTGSFSSDVKTGLYVKNVIKCEYDCNYFHHLHTGAIFTEGTASDVKISTNTFDPPFVDGLHYEDDLMINYQPYRGNKWLGKAIDYDGFAALNDIMTSDNGDIFQQRYIIQEQTNHYWPPSIDLPNYGGGQSWFILNPAGVPENCHEPWYGEEQSIKDIDRKIAETYDANTDKALYWDSGRGLYGKLATGNYDLSQEPEIASFFNNASSGKMAAYASVKDGQRQLLDAVETDVNQVYGWQQQMNQKLITIVELDSLLFINTTDDLQKERAKLLKDMQLLGDSITMVSNGIDAARTTQIAALQSDNTTLTTADSYQENEKIFNAIFLSTVAAGTTDFTEQQRDALYAIAMQCPEEGGRIVHRARSLYRLMDEEQEFPEGCSTVSPRAGNDNGNTKAATADKEKTIAKTGAIKVYPNPVSRELILEYTGIISGKLALYSSLGQQVYHTDLRDNTNRIRINTGKLENGIYYLQLYNDAASIFTTRIVIIH